MQEAKPTIQKYYIYKITNTQNGMVYIGQTKQRIYRRLIQHFDEAQAIKNDATHQSSQRKIMKAINDFGEDAFIIETLCIVYNDLEANDKECEFIEAFDAVHKGYNCNRGNITKTTLTPTSNEFVSFVAECIDRLGLESYDDTKTTVDMQKMRDMYDWFQSLPKDKLKRITNRYNARIRLYDDDTKYHLYVKSLLNSIFQARYDVGFGVKELKKQRIGKQLINVYSYGVIV